MAIHVCSCSITSTSTAALITSSKERSGALECVWWWDGVHVRQSGGRCKYEGRDEIL